MRSLHLKYQQESSKYPFDRKSKKDIKRSKIQNKSYQYRVTRLQSIPKTKGQNSLLNEKMRKSCINVLESQQLSINRSKFSHYCQSKSNPSFKKSSRKSQASTFSNNIPQLHQQNCYWKEQFKTGMKNLQRSQIPPALEENNFAIVEQIKSKSVKNIDRSQIKSIKIIDRYQSNYFLNSKSRHVLNNKLKIGSGFYYRTLYNDCNKDQAVWEYFRNEKNPMILKEINRFKNSIQQKESIKLRMQKRIILENENECEFIELEFKDNQSSIKLKTSYIKILQSKRGPKNIYTQTFYRIIWSKDQPQSSSLWYKFKKQDHQTILVYQQKRRFFHERRQLRKKELTPKTPQEKHFDNGEISQLYDSDKTLKEEEQVNELKWAECYKNQALNLKVPNGSILQISYIRILESVQIPNSTRHLFRILWNEKQSESEGIWHQFHPKDYANRILFRELKRFQSEQKRKQQMEGRKLLEEMKMKQTNEKFDDRQNAKALYLRKENSIEKYQQSDRSVSLKKKPKKLIKRQKKQMKNCQKCPSRTNEQQEIELEFECHNEQNVKIKTSYIKILQSKRDPKKHQRQTLYRIIWYRDQPQSSSRWYKFKEQDHKLYFIYRSKQNFFKQRKISNQSKQLSDHRLMSKKVKSSQKQLKNQQEFLSTKQQQQQQSPLQSKNDQTQPKQQSSTQIDSQQIENTSSSTSENLIQKKIQEDPSEQHPGHQLSLNPLSTIIDKVQQQRQQHEQSKQHKQFFSLQQQPEPSQQKSPIQQGYSSSQSHYQHQLLQQEFIQFYRQNSQRQQQDKNNVLQQIVSSYHHQEGKSNLNLTQVNNILQQQTDYIKDNNTNKEKLPELENVKIEVKQQHQPQYEQANDTAIFSENQEKEKCTNEGREERKFNFNFHQQIQGKVDDEEDISFVYVKKEFIDQKQVFLPTFEIEAENTDVGEQSHQFYYSKR